MELTNHDVQKMILSGMLSIEALGNNKGASLLLYKGKSYYVWKSNSSIFFQEKWIWSKKHEFKVSAAGDLIVV